MNCKLFWMASMAATTFIAGPAAAQRGVGAGAMGSVAGAANATISRPDVPARVGSAEGNVSSGARGAAGLGMGGPGSAALGVTQNAQLSSRLQTILPSGTPASTAAAGFETEGQFIAAAHVAHNLNIPFDQLKAQMTGSHSVSMGKAIRKLRPDLDGKSIKDNVSLAGHQADRDIAQSDSAGKQDRVAARVASNTQLAARLTPLLPSGTTLSSAAAGFKNEGQFIAALHVAKNQGVPFADVKDRVTAGESLGAAVQSLKPGMDSHTSAAVAATAEAQAKDDQSGAAVSANASARANARVKAQ